MRPRVPVLLLGLLLLLPSAHAAGIEGLQAQLDTSNLPTVPGPSPRWWR